MDDVTLSTKKELEGIEQNLVEIGGQIQLLLNKQSALHERRTFLKQHLKLQCERQKTSHDWCSEDFAWSAELREKRETVFGIKSFRPNQLETINTVFSGLDCVIIMPTGAGKSLCYQLPALLSKGLTLVISPLVSLMEDQVMALEKLGVSAVMLHAGSSKETVNAVYADMVRSPCKLRLLYVTPEKLAKSKRFMNKLEQCNKVGLLSQIAIDEVHCCSQWGHDFRPDYKFLGILKKQFPKVAILGLTATASSSVLIDVQKILHLPHAQVYKGSFNRKNLYYSVEAKPPTHDQCMDRLSDLIQSRFANQSGIVYCFSRKDTFTIASDLGARRITAAPYNADLDPVERSNTHTSWLTGKTQVIVATIAFGMGIDKPDVRFVIHHSLSKSMENYYQESGRAGRDDSRAECVLMYRLADVYRQSCMVFSDSTGLDKLYDMVKYCIDPNTCRRSLIAGHFSEVWNESNCDGMCDHCTDSTSSNATAMKATQADAQLVFEILDKAVCKDSRLTGRKVLEAMIGKGVSQNRVENVSKLSRDECELLLARMVTGGSLREEFHFTPYSTISYLVVGNRQSAANALDTAECSRYPIETSQPVELDSDTKPRKRKADALGKRPKGKKRKDTRDVTLSDAKKSEDCTDVIVLSD